MSLFTQVRTKVRNVVNRVRRPSAVVKAQREHVKRFPTCAACGSTNGVQGHHVKPYKKFPELAASPQNFVSLCEGVGSPECHLHIGHGGDFHYFNPHVEEDAVAYFHADFEERKRIVLDARHARELDG